MSHEQDKLKNSKRRFEDDNAVKKQLKIAKQHNSFSSENKVVKEPHRLSKHHAMDCGNPGCYLCGNPRHIHKDGLTTQEKRLFQDIEKTSDKRSNGIVPNEKNENYQ